MISLFIQKLEHLLGFKLRYFIEGGTWLAIGKITATGASFILSVAYARYLSRGLYGDYRYVLSVMGIAGILALPGIATAITRGVARGYEGTFRQGGQIIFLSSFGITLISFGAAVFFFLLGNTTLASGFTVVAIGAPFVEGLGNWRAYFDGKKEFKRKTLYNLWQQLFNVIVMAAAVAVIVLFHFGAAKSIAFLFLAYAIGKGLPNIIISKHALTRVSAASPKEPGSLRYGLHLSALNIPSTVANYLDAVLLHAFLGPAALAVYSFAIAIPEQIKAFLGIPIDMVFPRFSEKKLTKDFKKSLVYAALKLTAISALVVAVYIFAAPFVYSTFFPRYMDSIRLSQVFTLPLIFFPFTIFNTALKAEGNVRKIYIYNLTAPIIQITLLIALIPTFGLWGAINARIIAKLINLLLPFLLFLA